jgi:hypothetical protein
MGLLVVGLLVWALVEGVERLDRGSRLKTGSIQHGIVSLQTAKDPTRAQAIVEAWKSHFLLEVARRNLADELPSIYSYTLAVLFLTAWTAWAMRSKPGNLMAAAAGVVVLVGAYCDVAENLPSISLLGADSALGFNGTLTCVRVLAMTKFVCFLVVAILELILIGGVWRAGRRWAVRRPELSLPNPPLIESTTRGSQTAGESRLIQFRALIESENDGIFVGGRQKDLSPRFALNQPADEPRITFRAADVIGLALSGGGIRSATFNLGLLEGLHRLGLLELFDYLSTVSGGGYIGSFWSEWLRRREEAKDTAAPLALFPTFTADTELAQRIDSDQERHHREFSRFLAPRLGLFEIEMWRAVVAVLSGLIPALLIGLSVIGVTVVVWLLLTLPLASGAQLAASVAISVETALILALFEVWWRRSVRDESAEAKRDATYVLWSIICVLLVGLLILIPPHFYQTLLPRFDRPFYSGGWQPVRDDNGLVKWWHLTGIIKPKSVWILSLRLFDASLVWIAAAVLLIMGRLVTAMKQFRREAVAAYDRVIMRLLGLAVVWFALALLWHLSINLDSIGGSLAAATVSAGVFATLRNWIGVALAPPKEAGFLDRLKPYVPQALAYLTIVLTAGVVGQLLSRIACDDLYKWWLVSAVMLTLMAIALLIDPAQFGLHAFYRDRISRAYAGACRSVGAQKNRSSDPVDGDDSDLSNLPGRPLHLICCAANDLVGDAVGTLSRGARSAVLSRYGFAMGPFADLGSGSSHIKLGSAVTASAAAFNSNMGHISKQVGPAVAFLMSMLNLRLGLWVRHPNAPLADNSRRWPGLLLYREMLGWTEASGFVAIGDRKPPLLLRDVHLSDGGHFENLALYELVRRHCRYILLSDCGADPEVAFDDLGNALRRIREDFGVEISLDVEPIRRTLKGGARQHVAIGTIHYSATDSGILLYVKPSLTGDEPPDVLQYQTRNNAFPHEGTSDQFYDEAQWESYRRLGLHSAESIFAFVEEHRSSEKVTADWLFAQASHVWGPTPDGLMDRVLEMTARFASIDKELRRQFGPLLDEVFPEIKFIETLAVSDSESSPITFPIESISNTPAAGSHGAHEKMTAEMLCISRVIQLMEDVWTACDLDKWAHHRLNLGWINLFGRWATAPTFRFWWPLLSPMFSPGFRSFVDNRFPMPRSSSQSHVVPQKGRVQKVDDPAEVTGLAASIWRQRSAQPRRWEPIQAGRRNPALYENILFLPRVGSPPCAMQVGLAAVWSIDAEGLVGWTSDDFFVPPSLWGAGIGWYFLDELLKQLSLARTPDGGYKYRQCHVLVKAPPADAADKSSIADRRAFADQYRKIGFRQQLPDDIVAGSLLSTTLFDTFAQDHRDAMLVLVFDSWSRSPRAKV